MRLTLSPEQRSYLTSIGVSPETISKAAGGLAPPPGGQRRAGAWRRVGLLMATALGLALLLGAVPHANGQPRSPAAERRESTRVPRVEDRLAALQRQIETLPSTKAELEKLHEDVEKLTAASAALEPMLSDIRGRLALLAALEAQGRQLQGTLEQQLTTSAQDRTAWAKALGLLGLGNALFLVGLVLVGKSVLARELKRSEGRLLPKTAEQNTGRDLAAPVPDPLPSQPPGHPVPPEGSMRVYLTESPSQTEATPGRQPQWPPGPVPPPPIQMLQIIKAAEGDKHCTVPRVPHEPWTLGMATQQGNVRPENQDYGLSFTIAGSQVLVVADGCGGIPHGQRAAYLAVMAATMSVIDTYGRSAECPPAPSTVAQAAMGAAAQRLTEEGDTLHISAARDGLRTTLIIVVATSQEYGYAYIGDGGGYIVRASGALDQFLVPQKASSELLHVLAASLGPTVEGEPVIGTMPRRPGDFLLLGTDGVFDRVDDAFGKTLLRAAMQYEGNLQAVAEQVLRELVVSKDDAGYICDDNLTLALMGEGTQPQLAAGFWATSTPQHAQPLEGRLAAEPPAQGTCEPAQEVTV